MLTFTLNNQPFLLNRETTVRLTWRNPACNLDAFPGDVGMGIEIPVNPHNRALLGYPDRFEKYRTANDREFPGFEIRYSGYLLMGGTLVVQTATTESYSAWLRSNVGNLGKAHREKYISDIDDFRDSIWFNNKADYDPESDAYGCPKIFNPEFFYNKSRKVTVDRLVPNPNYVDLSWWQDIWKKQQPAYIKEPFETEELTEAFRISASYFVNDLHPDNTVKIPWSTCRAGNIHTQPLTTHVVSPMLFLNFVLKKIFLDARLVINDNFIAGHEDLKKLMIYNNFDITTMNFDFPLTEIQVTDWANGVGPMNYVRKVEGISRDYSAPFQYKNLLPKVQLKDFLLSVQNLLNVCFHFRRDGKVDIIDREAIISGPQLDLSKYMVNGWEMGLQKDVTLKFSFKHDKDDMYFSERWEDIEDFRENERDSLNNWEDLGSISSPEIGEIRYLTGQNIYVRYDYGISEEWDPETGNTIQTDTLGWQHFTSGFQNGYYNRGKEETEEISTGFSTLMGDQNLVTEQKGNIQSMRFTYRNFTPRLLFYMGNNQAKSETENISLDWEKAKTGLLETRWKNWARFWSQRQPVTGEANLPINMLDFVIRNIYSGFRAKEGVFILEELETEFSTHRIGISKIKGYKSNYIPAVTTMDSHWAKGNLVMDDALVDFKDLSLFKVRL